MLAGDGNESFAGLDSSKPYMKAIQIKQTGGPEVMELVDLPVPQPKANEAVVKIAAAGINFIDVYNREGRYKAPLPLVLGQEAAGVVSAVGSDVREVAVGDRVSLSRGPVTLWYSLYWNPLPFGRHLFMQALDLAIWRPALPVVNRLALGVGVLRVLISADSSYGKPDAVADAGAYYDFADYLWLRERTSVKIN